jgi:hypothetical protein
VRVTKAAARDDRLQAAAERIGTLGGVGQTLEQGAQIQTGSGGEDGEPAASLHISERSERVPPVFACRENFGRFDQIDQVMRYTPPLFYRRFAGSDVESAIDLR